MENLNIEKGPFLGYIPKDKKEYGSFIRFILNHADSVCFTIRPFLDDMDEFNNSIWAALRLSVMDYCFAKAATDPGNVKSHLIFFKSDYCLYDFLKNKNGIFDFGEEDPGHGITLSDLAFLKDGKVFCYTVTHENICDVTENIYKQLCGKYKWKKAKKWLEKSL